jgi:hypothetical protein
LLQYREIPSGCGASPQRIPSYLPLFLKSLIKERDGKNPPLSFISTST